MFKYFKATFINVQFFFTKTIEWFIVFLSLKNVTLILTLLINIKIKYSVSKCFKGIKYNLMFYKVFL